jgi:Glyceraldehyde 3-phosphate dehydrogenase, NAD binding domain
MTARVGINGFGRMGRLVLRAGWHSSGLSFVHVNETKGGVAAAAHLLKFDPVHGRWPLDVREEARQIVQAGKPGLLRRRYQTRGGTPDGVTATWLAFVLAAFQAAIALALRAGADPTLVVVVGLIACGMVFAMNSSVHSYLILAYTDSDKVAMNVGFYYMANACGRLAGTILSGLVYPRFGLVGCLWACPGLVLASAGLARLLPADGQARVSLSAIASDE